MSPPTQPCAHCGVPVARARHRPGRDWYCPAPSCRAERRNRRRRQVYRERGGRERAAGTCERCARTYYPVPGRASLDGALCSRPACVRERAHRAGRRARAARGIPPRRRVGAAYPPELADRVRELYGSGLPVRAVAAEVGKSPTTVRRVMDVCGIPGRTRAQARRLRARGGAA